MQQIRRFAIVQTAKVFGVLNAILLLLQASTFWGKDTPFKVSPLLLLVLLGIAGFVLPAISCALYNLAAKMVGGIELRLENELTGQRIRRVSIFQTAKVFAILYGMLGLLFLPIILVIAHVAPKPAGFASGLAVLFPVLFAMVSFICVAIMCVVYNVLARVIGGIEMQIDGGATLA